MYLALYKFSLVAIVHFQHEIFQDFSKSEKDMGRMQKRTVEGLQKLAERKTVIIVWKGILIGVLRDWSEAVAMRVIAAMEKPRKKDQRNIIEHLTTFTNYTRGQSASSQELAIVIKLKTLKMKKRQSI